MYSRGLTLIEAAIGLGFLALVFALAIPKLWQRDHAARHEKLETVFSAVTAGAQIAHASALVHHQTAETGGIDVDGVHIDTTFSYPSANATGIVAASGIDPVSDAITVHPESDQRGSAFIFAVDDAPGICLVRYAAPHNVAEEPQIVWTDGKDGGKGC